MELRSGLVLAFVALSSPLPARAAPEGTCLLGGRETAAASCVPCHAGDHGRAHPVDLDYAAAALRSRVSLRSEAEVVARGVFLPDGRLQCVSCHDAASPWAAKLALPPGAPAVPAVSPRAPATYEAGPSWRVAARPGVAPAPGAAVSAAPLCAACHALGG